MAAVKCREDACGMYYEDKYQVCPFCGHEAAPVDPHLEALNAHLYSMSASARTEGSTEARLRRGPLD